MLNSVRLTIAGAALAAGLALSAAPAAATVSCVAPAPAPAAVTETAIEISDTSATLQGTVNPNGCATTYHFEYGTSSPTYGTTTTETPAGSGTTNVAATAAITGLKPDTTYHFAIVATSVGGAITAGDATFTTKPGCVAGLTPTVVTKAATSVAASSATVSATVNPNGCTTTYWFQYGTATGPLKMTATHNTGSGTTPVTLSANISNLSSSTGYVFRVVATSAGGLVDGTELAFQTKAGCVPHLSLPSAITGAASGVTETSAILNGAVGPNDCATKFHFDYGPTAYGRSTKSHSVGSGTGGIPVSASIDDLQPGTVYHFRIVATSSGGTTYGGDVIFRTASAPVARIRVDGRRPSVRLGFLVAVHLHCTVGGADCVGRVSLHRDGRGLGGQSYAIAPGTTSVVLVRLNGRGRRLVRHHRLLRRVEVVAASQSNTAVRFVTLIRVFRP